MPLLIETPLFTINLAFWQWLSSLPALEFIEAIIGLGGWTIIALFFIDMGAHAWKEYREKLYEHAWKWSVLAVDLPPNMLQSPMAVEQIFAHLSGAAISPNVGESFWKGKKQKWFSLEILSIEGYIQFLIRVESEFRDLVEASIYAQYPEAEITEIEDYVDMIPSRYPNDEYDVMGVEFKLADKDAYPIRTYPSFQYNLSKDAVFSDPMAAFLENFTRIGKGEHLWYQIIIEPANSRWKEEGIELVKAIVAGKEKAGNHKSPLMGKIFDVIIKFIIQLINEIVTIGMAEESAAEHAEETPKKVSELTPGVKSTVEAIEEKLAKVGFKSKVRVLYAARKEVYNPDKCLNGIVGALNQFHIQSRNAIVPQSKTKVNYAFKTQRTITKKNRFVKWYKKRKLKSGANPYIMNIEELATLWHFPLPFVKTPLVQKSTGKRAEPPINLPIESWEAPLIRKPITPPKTAEEQPLLPTPPEELPYA